MRAWLWLVAGCLAFTLLHILLPKGACDRLTPLPWLHC